MASDPSIVVLMALIENTTLPADSLIQLRNHPEQAVKDAVQAALVRVYPDKCEPGIPPDQRLAGTSWVWTDRGETGSYYSVETFTLLLDCTFTYEFYRAIDLSDKTMTSSGSGPYTGRNGWNRAGDQVFMTTNLYSTGRRDGWTDTLTLTGNTLVGADVRLTRAE